MQGKPSLYVTKVLLRDVGFRAYFIDHGMSLGGAEWQLRDVPLGGVYFRRDVYSHIDLSGLIEKALCRLEAITETSLLATIAGVPSGWFASGDRESFLALLEKLLQRQRKIRTIVARHLKALDLPAPLNAHLPLHARI